MSLLTLYQQTLARPVSITGKALHTGETVTLSLKPAPVDYGRVFRRIDSDDKPEIKPDIDHVDDLIRSTNITTDRTKISTVEHILSALSGSGIHNVCIEMDASEPPILDGSAQPFIKLIEKAGKVEQDKDCPCFTLTKPIAIHEGDRSLIALPYDGFKITCTSTDDRGIHTQHLSLDIDQETYAKEIAPARTFTIYEDIEALMHKGKIRGGSLDSAIVIKGKTILAKEPLRFKDEFVRHKILDIIGDLVLLGRPIKAHIVAIRPGHALNARLTRALRDQIRAKIANPSNKSHPGPKASTGKKAGTETRVTPTEAKLDISRILDLMPHRYPFLMIDRVVAIEEGQTLTAIKNVTFNEPYFLGHFPGRPLMPGVLQLEAMAQASGALMLRYISGEGKIAFFMSCDKVKFRRTVEPGDQLQISVKIEKHRGKKLALASASCQVDGKLVSSVRLMFSVVDKDQTT